MQLPAAALDTLTEKEKATLRLIVRGHDAMSAARHLDLSVHTINERLREARRKLAVSSSREAARLLFEAEENAPQSDRYDGFGEVPADRADDVRAGRSAAPTGRLTAGRSWEPSPCRFLSRLPP